eukprot:6472003-Amphidinium_carterae.1
MADISLKRALQKPTVRAFSNRKCSGSDCHSRRLDFDCQDANITSFLEFAHLSSAAYDAPKKYSIQVLKEVGEKLLEVVPLQTLPRS